MRKRLEKIEARAEQGAGPIPRIRSARALQIAHWFGLDVAQSSDPCSPAGKRSDTTGPPSAAPAREAHAFAPPTGVQLPDAGQIMLITGPSGAGKSALLRALLRSARQQAPCKSILLLDLSRARLRDVPCVDQFPGALGHALDMLNRVGLGEAYTYLRTPPELSDGQRWRLRLAVCLSRAARTARRKSRSPRRIVLTADEFCAVLDRVSAAVVARALRRTIDRFNQNGLPLAAAVATSHDDLSPALRPDVTIRCDFGCVTASPARRRE